MGAAKITTPTHQEHEKRTCSKKCVKFSGRQIKEYKTDSVRGTHEQKINAKRVSVVKAEGNIPLGISRRKWHDDIKIHFKETGKVDVDWICIAQDKETWKAAVDTIMKICVPEYTAHLMIGY
jgi:hypothetical protein